MLTQIVIAMMYPLHQLPKLEGVDSVRNVWIHCEAPPALNRRFGSGTQGGLNLQAQHVS